MRCILLCVFITASVFSRSRPLMWLRTGVSVSALCVTEREWLTSDIRVTHPGGSAKAAQPVWQVIISVSHSSMTATSSETKHTAHVDSLPDSSRNAYPSQSIGRSIGGQLAIHDNQYNPCCMAPQTAQWLWHLIKLLIAALSFLRYPPWTVIESGWTIQLSAAVC